MVAPKFLPVDGEGILFLDEPTAAPQITRAGCYQLVLDRKPGEYRLPDGWGVRVNRHDSFGGAIISTSVWTKAKPLAQGAKLL